MIGFKKLAAVATLGTSMALVAFSGPANADGGVHATNYVATFSNGTTQFKVRLVDADDVAAAYKNLNTPAGQSRTIINGKIVRNGGVDFYNSPYTWHLDPNDLAFVDMATEVCDADPRDVENGTITSDRYCPWHQKVIKIEQVAI
ncbi:hypothetical protein Lfu02_62280 [Longispora fulva]|uniref:BP74 N-terminal domain-containing protein n=1 Tax=Longispora fulva TaxID=619741 RepID=A0A8J7GF17_9ACTN|nr:hypothetical protein [Longispora fulva]MBG6134648.1 hypothetical protein [Longispora fulva]GIG61856.1 hypothetical protein Lfu02_62280 [Longispora fulva]